MLKYVIHAGRVNELLERLYRVLNIRITFFDPQDCEVAGFHIKQMSPFCRRCRRTVPGFDARCRECDREHLRAAKRAGQIHVYHCHAGLLEGIVPLLDRRGTYLGAIVFGQLRDRDREAPPAGPGARQWARLARSSRREMLDRGHLLQYLGEYLVENELIRYQAKPWAEKLADHIRAHLGEKLTLAGLAAEVGRSASYLSHHFPREFGLSLKAYIRQERLDRAQALLAAGRSVRQTAEALGYYDEFHFSKDFKRRFGLPPVRFKPAP